MGSCNVTLTRNQLNELAMNMTTLLHTEVANRLKRLPDAQRVDPVLDLMRITAEVVRDLMQDSPESIEEFLAHFAPRGLH